MILDSTKGQHEKFFMRYLSFRALCDIFLKTRNFIYSLHKRPYGKRQHRSSSGLHGDVPVMFFDCILIK